MKQILILIGSILLLSSCMHEKTLEAEAIDSGDKLLEINLMPGEHYLHKFELFWFISKRNAPQMVLWAETPDGEYLETLMITNRAGKQSWLKAPGDSDDEIRRAEALPVWEHKRGIPVSNPDFGLLPDAVTQATPRDGLNNDFSVAEKNEIVLFFEINHSTDFNESYKAEAEPGDKNYNGGVWGSGQPSLVYRADIKPVEKGRSDSQFRLLGHGSPDGADGIVYSDLTGLTTALGIVERIDLFLIENE